MQGLAQVFGWVLKLEFLKGFRGYLGGAAVFLAGLSSLVCGLTGACDAPMDTTASVATMGTGLALIGIRGK